MDFTTGYQNEYHFIKKGDSIPEIRQGELLLESTSFCLYLRDSDDFCFGFINFKTLSHSGYRYRSELFEAIDKICVANGKKNYKVYYTNKVLEQIEISVLYSRLLKS